MSKVTGIHFNQTLKLPFIYMSGMWTAEETKSWKFDKSCDAIFFFRIYISFSTPRSSLIKHG